MLSPPLRRGDLVAGRVTGLDDEGRGVLMSGADVAIPLHVAGCLPGDEIRAEVEHVSPHAARARAWGRLLAVTAPAPERTLPICAAQGRCGGCALQIWDYQAQLKWKTERVTKVFQAAGLNDLVVLPCQPSPQTQHYRNHAKLVAGQDAHGKLILGAYAPRSHSVVDLAGCMLVEEPLEALAGFVANAAQTAGLQPFDEQSRRGTLRYVTLRRNDAGQTLVTLVTATPVFPEGADIAAALMGSPYAVAGVIWNINPTAGNAIFGTNEHVLAGVAHLRDRFGEAELLLASRAFAQVNRGIATGAYRDMAQWLVGTGSTSATIVDAYAGVGAIALNVDAHARKQGVTIDRLVAIESNDAATAAARGAWQLRVVQDRAADDADRFEVILADAAVGLARIASATAVALNPPRAGCTAHVLAEVARLAPQRLAYLSCDPQTLARDLAILRNTGFEVQTVQPLDMLPHTPHVETLVLLSRASQ